MYPKIDMAMNGIPYNIGSKPWQTPGGHRGPGAFSCLLQTAANQVGWGKKAVLIVPNTAYTKDVRIFVNQLIRPTYLKSKLVDGPAQEEVSLFGDYTFSQTVGVWLQYGLQPSGNLLSPFISTDSFEFTPEEYLDLRERLLQTIRKYVRLPRASAALEDLNTGFFRHQSLEECRTFLTAHLKSFLQRARVLTRDYLLAINDHSRRAGFQRRRELASRAEGFRMLQGMMNLPTDRRARKKQNAELREAWATYRKSWFGETVVAKAVPDTADLEAEQQRLEDAQQQLNRELAAAGLSLSPLTAEAGLADAGELERLAGELDTLVREIDEAGIYQLPLGGTSAATSSRQLQRLEGVLQRLSTSHAHLGELDDFYTRRHFWYAQPARLRRLLAPLLELPVEEWEAAFSAWYFDRCLERVPHKGSGQLRCSDLATLVSEPGEQATDKGIAEITFLSPDDQIPAGTQCVVDLSEGECPTGYSGEWFGLRPLSDPTACYHALAGVLDPRLTLLQTFLPLDPAPWSAIEVTKPPMGERDQVLVQLSEEGEWLPLGEWTPEPTDHLRIYLPGKFNASGGETLLRTFDAILMKAKRLTIFHSWSQNAITQALLSDGLNPNFLAAALLRAAEACTESPFDREALVAVGREILTRCGVPPPSGHPLAERLLPLLKERLPKHFFSTHQAWRDTFLPLVVQAPDGRKTVLLPAGRLPGCTWIYQEALRQQELRTAGLQCLEIDAFACWEDVGNEVERIAAYLTT